MNTVPSREEVLAKVQELAIDLTKMPADKVNPSSRLREDLEFDSLFTTQFIFSLEDDFDIETDDADSIRFVTIENAADYVLEKLKAK